MTAPSRGAPSRRLALGLLIACLVVPLVASFGGGGLAQAAPAPAQDAPAGPKDEVEPPSAGSAPMTVEEFAKWLAESRVAAALALALPYTSFALGVTVWVLWLLRFHAVRRGHLPPVPSVEPTRPFEPLQALGVLGVAFVAIAFAHSLMARVNPGGEEVVNPLLAMAIGLVPVGVWVVLRRRALRSARPQDPGDLQPFLGPPREARRDGGARVLRAAGLGAMTWAAAAPVVVAGQLVSLLFTKPEQYRLIEHVVRPEAAYLPWLIAGYAVVVAPFTEEALFRGLIYPTLRKLVGGRRNAWIAMVVTSTLFAAMHGFAFGFLSLFLLAIVLNWIFERTDSLLTTMVAHATFNGAVLLPILVRRAMG